MMNLIEAWFKNDLESKKECYRVDHTGNIHPYIIDNCARTDWDGHDISVDDEDVTWCIISTQTGDYFVHNLEASDIITVLSFLGFTKE
jgi:hypothetical protein